MEAEFASDEAAAAEPGRDAPAQGGAYRGTWFRGERPTPEARRLPKDGAEAKAIVERVRSGRAQVESVESETRRLPPPLLYDLTELQRHANRLHGLSAKETLAVAQALYEEKKLLTYPRTDSRHLSSDVAAGLPAVVAAIAGPYAPLLAPGTGERPLGRRFVDDSKVTDHHAIVPTAVSAAGLVLSRDERRVYDLVCRRLLMAWHDEHVFAVTSRRHAGGERPARPGRGPLRELGHRGAAGRLEGPRAASLAPGPARARRRRAGRRGRSGAGPPAGPRRRPAEARRERRGRREEDAAAPPLHRRDAADGHGEGRGRPRRPRAVGSHEGARPRHSRHPRRDDRDAPAARLRGAAGQGPGRHRHRHPARRPRPPPVKSAALTGEWEAQLARMRRKEVGLPEFMEQDRGLRARPGRADPGGRTTADSSSPGSALGAPGRAERRGTAVSSPRARGPARSPRAPRHSARLRRRARRGAPARKAGPRSLVARRDRSSSE